MTCLNDKECFAIITYLRVKETKTQPNSKIIYNVFKIITYLRVKETKTEKLVRITIFFYCLIITYLRVKETKT